MKQLALLVLATGLFAIHPQPLRAQARDIPSAAPKQAAGESSEERGRKLLDQMLEALGGDAWLQRHNVRELGRIAHFFQGAPNGYVVDFTTTRQFATADHPEALRIGFITDKSIIFPGKKIDIVQIWTDNTGHEVTYKGNATLPREQIDDYYRRQDHSIESIFRVWLKSPGVMIVDGGSTMVERRLTERVTILSANNDAVTLDIDIATHLPRRRTFEWRNNTFKDRDEDAEEYDDYHTIQGLPTPLTLTRYHNGEMTTQTFLTKVEYDVDLPPGTFDPNVLLEKETVKKNNKNYFYRIPLRSHFMKHDSILGTVGNTPIVRINKLAPDGINLYVKIEAFNPLGSVKDRLALGVIEDAERSGALKPGQTVIEATSGNTGIGLAMVCAAKGYPLVVTMAESFSIERRKLMRFLGAKVIVTPAPARGLGMVKKAEELAAKNGWFLTRQFTNEANADMHSRTTAQEILRDFEGTPLDYWVTGFGTGGTLKGVSRVLAEKRPDTKIILCEPDAAPMISSGIEQPHNSDGSPSASHPSWTPHPQQGWSPDFIPKLAQDALDAHRIHKVVRIENPEAMRTSQELAKKEGIFVGISSGATFAGALRIAAEAPTGSTILAMLPDTGERYLSTPLFADVAVDMTPEELEISKSTPSAQLPPPAA